MKKFIVIILDGFGIDAINDEKSNTFKSILQDYKYLKLENLEKLGLMNAYNKESINMKFSKYANFGKCSLMHFGADTFMGHQEIMGTLPTKPLKQPFKENVDKIADYLKKNNHKVEIISRNGLKYILCDDYVTIADNLECDLGMCYNVTAPLDFISFEKEYKIGQLVREVVTVSRVIVFGGKGNTIQDLFNAEEIKENKFIGIVAAKSKSYEKGYQCRHLGYGVNKDSQVPTILTNNNIDCVLIGKVADIVINENGENISCVATKQCIDYTLEATKNIKTGLICTNIQETDLAGHSQSSKKYKEILYMVDKGIGNIIPLLNEEDILLITADHGNDPNIGHSKHTREFVPILLYKKNLYNKQIGIRKTLSDIGATICKYFNVNLPENGVPFI